MGILGLGKKDRSKVIGGAVDLVKGIRLMVDEKQLTAEEATKYNAAIADASSKFVNDTLNENTERSQTRRHLAISFIWFFHLLTIALIILWRFDPAWFDASYELIMELKYPFAYLSVIAFFFGGHYLRMINGTAKK